MKTLNLLAPVAILVLIFAACKEDTSFEPEISGEPYTIRLNLGGEITFSDSQIAGRTEGDENFTYYFIQINDVGNGVHASGVFNTIPSDLEVTLFPDRQYEIDLRAIRKGQSGGLVINQDSILNWDGRNVTVTNRLAYTQSLPFSLSSSRSIRYYLTDDSTTTSATDILGRYPVPLNSYYSEATIDDVSAQDSLINMRLIRNAFGYRTAVKNLSSGQLNVSIGRRFSSYLPGQDSITEEILSYPVMSTDSSFYSRSYSVTVSHQDTVSGIPVNNSIYSGSIPFTRMHIKNIVITMPDDTTASSDGNFGFTFEFEDIPFIEGDTVNING